MRLPLLLLAALFSCCVESVIADPITYSVAVNTSAISGTSGSLDLNFNPGPLVTQPASLQILNFTSNGMLANCATNVQGFCSTGDVSGQLPATLTFDNESGFNDYFDDFKFGSTLSFDLRLYGPALSAPDGVSTSGTAFAFSMFSDGAGTVPTLTRDLADGFALTAVVNLDGSVTLTNYSAQTNVLTPTSSAPEPSGFALVGTALAIGVGACRARNPKIFRSKSINARSCEGA